MLTCLYLFSVSVSLVRLAFLYRVFNFYIVYKKIYIKLNYFIFKIIYYRYIIVCRVGVRLVALLHIHIIAMF